MQKNSRAFLMLLSNKLSYLFIINSQLITYLGVLALNSYTSGGGGLYNIYIIYIYTGTGGRNICLPAVGL